MNNEFPKSTDKYLKAEMFQDQEIPLTYLGWEKKGNEDRTIKGVTKSWKENVKYCLRYSYPEYAMDMTTGEKMLGSDGQPFINRNYDPAFPKGYTVVYHFEEGQLESGSLPLFKAFCMVRPKSGDQLVIGKTGKDKETKWKVKKSDKNSISSSQKEELDTIQLDDLGEATPF